jgi:hypothetical protein
LGRIALGALRACDALRTSDPLKGLSATGHLALRDAHRRGLARFLETGSSVVLDRRLELSGMRRDGTEFRWS